MLAGGQAAVKEVEVEVFPAVKLGDKHFFLYALLPQLIDVAIVDCYAILTPWLFGMLMTENQHFFLGCILILPFLLCFLC